MLQCNIYYIFSTIEEIIMKRSDRIKDKIFMDILPGAIAFVVVLGMIGGVMFISTLTYIPK